MQITNFQPPAAKCQIQTFNIQKLAHWRKVRYTLLAFLLFILASQRAIAQCYGNMVGPGVGSYFLNPTTTDLLNHYGIPLGPNPTLTTTENIVIEGTLRVDCNITFEQLHKMYFITNASMIQLEPSMALTVKIKNCELQGLCEQMWEGIHATNTLHTLIVQDSYLGDMLGGVYVKNTTNFSIHGNVFNNNQRAIFCEENANVATSLPWGEDRIYDNIFTIDGNPMLNPCLTNPCKTVAIELKNNYKPIYIYSNQFSGMNAGVYVLKDLPTPNTNVPAHIVLNTFTEIHDANFPKMNYNSGNGNFWQFVKPGAAISAEDITGLQNATTQLDLHATDNEIIECDRAIMVNASSVDFQRNSIFNCHSGIVVTHQLYNNATIVRNLIRNCIWGIQVWGGTYLSTYNVSNNDVTMPDYLVPDEANPNDFYVGVYGIYLVHSPNWNGNNFATIIRNNRVENPERNGECYRFVRLAGPDLYIRNNIAEMNTTDLTALPYNNAAARRLYGFNLIACSEANVIKNIATGTPEVRSITGTAGIKLESLLKSLLHCNKTWQVNRGWHVQGNCSNLANTYFVDGNSFNWQQYGIYFDAAGTFGNVGTGPGSTFGVGNFFNNTTSLGPLHLMSISNNSPNFYKNHTGVMQANSGVLLTAYQVTSVTNSPPGGPLCAGAYYQHKMQLIQQWIADSSSSEDSLGTDGALDSTRARQIIEDELDYPYYQAESEENADYRLYKDVSDDLATVSNSDVLTFCSDYANSDAELLRNYNSTVQTRAESGLSALAYDIYINTKLSALANMDATTTMEQATKFMQGILLKRLKSEGLSTVDMTSLVSLANQCPLSHGESVYDAQALLVGLRPGIVFNTLPACIANAGQNKNGENPMLKELELASQFEEQQQKAAAQFLMYPNPSTADNITIDVSTTSRQISAIEITNTYGQVLLSKQFYAGNITANLNIENLPQGTYFVIVNYTNNDKAAQVLIRN
ncbi:MAG: Secretion system C-terminal sorting domain [Bacteroidota bacterium]|jgi:hypothetical protein